VPRRKKPDQAEKSGQATLSDKTIEAPSNRRLDRIVPSVAEMMVMMVVVIAVMVMVMPPDHDSDPWAPAPMVVMMVVVMMVELRELDICLR
jgi:hypothetical protein